MGKEIHYTLKFGTPLTAEEIAMVEAARSLNFESDSDNSAIDPETSPLQYEAMMRAVADRNRRLSHHHVSA